MNDLCGDNRFELIEKYKKKLIEATNIENVPNEMAVLDNILFRFWQMGWLDKLELPTTQQETSIMTVTVDPDSKEIERVARKIKNTPVMVLPSAEPERKKGKWIKEDNIYETVTCSVCYGVRRDNRINHITFCNCCGAEMKGEVVQKMRIK